VIVVHEFFWRRWRGIRLAFAGVALALVLAGCGVVQVAYNNADSLTYWWLDSLIDFETEQGTAVREALARLHARHRREELPRYAALVAKLRRDALAETSPAKVCDVSSEVRQTLAAFSGPTEDFIVEVGAGITARQMAHLAAQFDKRNREWRKDWLEAAPGKRDQRRSERMVDAVERFYGRLSEMQSNQLKTFIERTEFPGEQIYAVRLQRQSEALAMLVALRDAVTEEQKRLAARRWLSLLQEPPSETYRQASERNLRASCSFLAELHNSMDAAQRQGLADNLARYETDARALAKTR
jgi:hypothetical protein